MTQSPQNHIYISKTGPGPGRAGKERRDTHLPASVQFPGVVPATTQKKRPPNSHEPAVAPDRKRYRDFRRAGPPARTRFRVPSRPPGGPPSRLPRPLAGLGCAGNSPAAERRERDAPSGLRAGPSRTGLGPGPGSWREVRAEVDGPHPGVGPGGAASRFGARWRPWSPSPDCRFKSPEPETGGKESQVRCEAVTAQLKCLAVGPWVCFLINSAH